MKNTLATLALVLTATTATAEVTTSDAQTISNLMNRAGLEHTWSGANSLWIKKPVGFNSKLELESVGHTICDATQGAGFYVITFWHSLNGHGKLARIKCRSRG